MKTKYIRFTGGCLAQAGARRCSVSFFGTNRQGPPRKLWLNEREAIDLEGTHGGPTRLAGTQGLQAGPADGLSAWLPEPAAEGIDSDREICDECGHPLLTCRCDDSD